MLIIQLRLINPALIRPHLFGLRSGKLSSLAVLMAAADDRPLPSRIPEDSNPGRPSPERHVFLLAS